jgi:hypothetical protein
VAICETISPFAMHKENPATTVAGQSLLEEFFQSNNPLMLEDGDYWWMTLIFFVTILYHTSMSLSTVKLKYYIYIRVLVYRTKRFCERKSAS